ncbi:uncharacterized protein LOC106659816 [Trichogramma pretiosum]|uniref:uncharacterized protein LOC106659816 n=1 Tax=Trichogramma pretiosum TaxID=7493 RepID=UPI0006C966F5|nr:uncharacterized protein LOC106659816 [Trichogramma pretiosum]
MAFTGIVFLLFTLVALASAASSAREFSESLVVVDRRSLESDRIGRGHANLIKRSAESNSQEEKEQREEDLETAAGTNVLRPLFVYRRQLAYKNRNRRAKKGSRRPQRNA